MATVFERIDVSMQGNGLAGALAGQIGKLTDAASKVRALMSNPPAAIPQLAAGVGSVGLPTLDVSAFAGGIASLEGAVPGDLSTLIQAITAALDTLKVGVKADVTVKLETYVEAVRAVQRLLNANFAPPPDLFKSEAEVNASAGEVLLAVAVERAAQEQAAPAQAAEQEQVVPAVQEEGEQEQAQAVRARAAQRVAPMQAQRRRLPKQPRKRGRAGSKRSIAATNFLRRARRSMRPGSSCFCATRWS